MDSLLENIKITAEPEMCNNNGENATRNQSYEMNHPFFEKKKVPLRDCNNQQVKTEQMLE